MISSFLFNMCVCGEMMQVSMCMLFYDAYACDYVFLHFSAVKIARQALIQEFIMNFATRRYII